MSQWSNNDNAANSVNWAAAQLNKVANTANKTALFGNTTADAFVTGQTVAVVGVNGAESRALRAGAGPKASPGWNLRREGSGGRAGRITNENLVAFSGTSMIGDASDDALAPDAYINIIVQPLAASANSADDEQAVFTVSAEAIPSGTVVYSWEYTTDPGNTASYDVADDAGFADETTDTLTVDANTIADGTLIRVQMSVTGGDNVYSDAVELTVTS